MADGPLLLNKFFDPSTPSMRKGRDGEKKWKKWKMENNGENSGPLSSLPVDRLTATDCNGDCLCQKLQFCFMLQLLATIDKYCTSEQEVKLGKHLNPNLTLTLCYLTWETQLLNNDINFIIVQLNLIDNILIL